MQQENQKTKEELDRITHMNYNLQRKLNLSKKKADQYDSIEARCIQLENTNKRLLKFVSTSKSPDIDDHFNIQSQGGDRANQIELLVEEEDMPQIARARQSLEENLIKDDADESNAHLSNDEDEVNGESGSLLHKYTQKLLPGNESIISSANQSFVKVQAASQQNTKI